MNNKNLNLEEKRIKSQNIYEGVLLQLNKDIVELPDKKKSIREFIHLYGAVAIVPFLNNGNIIMEKQYRYPINRIVTEIPAGKIDKDEDPLKAAKRELKEETGYTAKTWINIGIYEPSPAYCDEKIYLYIAKDLQKGNQLLDDGEFINIEEIPIKELIKDIMNGEIQDGKTQVALLKTYYLLEQE